MENLYNYIEETAKKHGYRNITEYCKATGIPRATMSELKAGRTKKLSAKTAQVIFNTLQIPLNTLLGIDVVTSELNTTPEYLTGETDEPGVKKEQPTVSDGLPKSVIELLGVVATLSEEEAASLLAFLKANRKPK